MLVALVIVQAKRPPVLDLPQLLDQAKCFLGVLRGEEPDLRVVWTAPNKLGYVPVLAGYLLGGEAWAPRLATLLIALVWLGSLHTVSALARRPLESTVLASTLLFNSSFYGGFVNSVVGLAAVLFWVWELRRDPAARRWHEIAAMSCLGSLLLYYGHALWLAVGGFAVATWVLLFRFSWREVFSRALGAVPTLLLSLHWGPSLKAAGWQTTMVYGETPLDRLTTLWVLSAFGFGGVQGVLEQLLMVVLIGWLVLGAIRAVSGRGEGVDGFLLALGLVCLSVAFLGPEKLDKTVVFAPRWGAPGFALLCLALPAPRAPSRLLATIALSACLLQSTWTSFIWARFDRIDMAGFEEVLEAVPRGAAVFPMELVRPHPDFMMNPFLQASAYAALERNAEIPFRFADVTTSLVVRRNPEEMRPERDRLVWTPLSVTRNQLEGFNFLLLHGERGFAAALEKRVPGLAVALARGEWSLVAIDPAQLGKSQRSLVGEVVR